MAGFDYKAFVETLTENARNIVPNIVPSEFSSSEKDFVIDKIYTFSLRTGEALCNKNDDSFDEEQLQLMIQIVAEWMFNKSVELMRSQVPQSRADEILEDIAYKIFETMVPAFRAGEDIDTILAKVEKVVELDLSTSETQEKEDDLASNYASDGYNFYLKDKYKDAEKCFKKALEINPGCEDALYYYGLYLEYIKDYKNAEIYAERLLKLNSKEAEYIRLYADIQNDMGNYKLAGEEYRKALELEPNNALLLNNYGAFLMNDPEYPERAKKYFYKAHELEPDNKAYKDNLKLAIMYSIPFFKHYNKLVRPMRESKFWSLFFILLLSTAPSLIRLAYRSCNFVEYPILKKVLIIAALLLAIYSITMFLVEAITGLLIKLKILK